MKRSRGQALIEFALVSPILLLLIMGIFDFSRVFITYAVSSNSLRSALRLAEVQGYNSSSPQYANCDEMRNIARNVLFAGVPTVDIIYKDSASNNTYTCTGSTMATSNLQTGDMLTIRVRATVNFITPLISSMFPALTMDFTGQRTIVSQVQLGSIANVAADSDFDGLNDVWEQTNFGNLNQSGTDDPDGDGCNNGCEETNNTNPNNPDTDGDGIPDGQELACGIDPGSGTAPDADGDGLDANLECSLNLDDSDPDFDGDGLNDGYEFYTSHTNPALADTDGDGLSDSLEVNTYHSNPLAVDTDSDGLHDAAEVVRGTDINDPDSDSDGLFDGEEVGFTNGTFAGWGTNPLNGDTDGDHLGDGYEVMINDTDARVRDADDTDPANPDSDGDGLNDGEEHLHFLTNPNAADTDGDTLIDGDEIYGTASSVGCGPLPPTDPLLLDTDGDGIHDDVDCVNGNDSDGDGLLDTWEISFFGTIDMYDGTDNPDNTVYDDYCNNECEETRGLNPLHPDTDDDGLVDGQEVLIGVPGYTGTNPRNPDTDGDGVKDGDEIANGIDPNNPDTDTDGLTDGQELKTGPGGPYPDGLGSNPAAIDTDNDGLTDYEEVTRGNSSPLVIDGIDTLPFDSDTDNDGLSDGIEVNYWFTDPLDDDTDGDTLLDGGEVTNGDSNELDMDGDDTNPTMWDTDGDGLSDSEEFLVYFTDPRSADMDGDGLSDFREVHFGAEGYSVTADGVTTTVTENLDPHNSDTDGDGAQDGDEVLNMHTNPKVVDTDGDGLDDGDEKANNTDPLKQDTDGDGWKDLEELTFGSSGYSVTVAGVTTPITRNLNPLLPDSDADGLNDWYETHMPAQNYYVVVNGVAPGTQITGNLDPTGRDTDNDGVDDGPEVNTWHSNPLNRHTDNDTIEDGIEVNFSVMNYRVRVNGTYQPYITASLSPILDDSDNDGLNDNVEVFTEATNPLVADTDADGLTDGYEVNFASQNYRVTVNGIQQAPINNRLNPLQTSSDSDTLSDGVEVNTRLTNPLASDTDADNVVDQTDVYPLNQPTISIACLSPANCQVSEPANNSPATYQQFRITAQYLNASQNIGVQYRSTNGTATSSNSTACSTSAGHDYMRYSTNPATYTFSASGNYDRSFQICADSISNPPKTGEAVTETFSFSIVSLTTNAAYAITSGPTSLTATITNR